LSLVKAKRKGQVTIPIELRRNFNLVEGSLLEAEEHKEGILLKSLPPIKARDVVGERTYKEIIRELDESRRKWWR
jgi:AbrB family looped-hinge helix DNA binding protein